MSKKIIKIGKLKIGAKGTLCLIAGPCVIEKEELCFKIAETLLRVTTQKGVPLIFKASYDKANRSSINSYRGPGLKKGLAILKKVKDEFKIPILTDIHCQEEIPPVSEIADVIQIPAFLSRQTSLITTAARTGRVINVKKGQFLAPIEMAGVIEKIEKVGGDKILLTERGTFFGYHNLVVDFRAIPIMQRFSYPVIFDASHSVQTPGSKQGHSGGTREFIPFLAKAAVACGCDGLFLEVHPEPEKALCDAASMLRLKDLPQLLTEVVMISKVIERDKKNRK
jgi:2-dehydro-3-deoxyphosphooctonate aldolase (KDO 8-P synthase)